MSQYSSETEHPPHVHGWIEHVQQPYHNDPQSNFHIPAKLLPNAAQEENEDENSINKKHPKKHSLIKQLNADIQRLSDMSASMRHEQFLRSLMEAADLTKNDHPVFAKLRRFARDRRYGCA
jgi:hypothetical protein